MVVLAVSILNKAGKALISRQFVEMNRSRMEGLLAAFPKLIGSGQQHTFVETENVRYVYQPLEELFMVLVTTKTSNILEDLDALHLFSRTVPEYCRAVEEDEIIAHSFELLFAFDEIVSLGYNENIQINQVRTFTEMDSHEEKIQEMVAKNKEMEAREQQKLHIKQMEIQRKEISKKTKAGGIPSKTGFGGGSLSGGNSGSGFGNSSTSLSSQSDFSRDEPSYSRPPAGKSGPAPGRGMQLGKKQTENDFLEAMKAEDGLESALEETRTAAPTKAAAAAAPQEKTESVHIIIEEKVIVVSNRDGGLENLEVKGDLLLRISDPNAAFVRINLSGVDEKLYQFKTHPNVDKRLFSSEGTIGLKDSSRSFPVGQALGVLKWRYQTKDESAIPLSINCWPSPANDGSCDINIEYELERDNLVLNDVVVVIPIPQGAGNPVISTVDGDYNYNKQRRFLEWQLPTIDSSNKSGTMEFSVANADAAGFFPVTVSFTSSTLLSGLQIVDVTSIKDNKPTKYSSHVSLVPEEFSVV